MKTPPSPKPPQNVLLGTAVDALGVNVGVYRVSFLVALTDLKDF